MNLKKLFTSAYKKGAEQAATMAANRAAYAAEQVATAQHAAGFANAEALAAKIAAEQVAETAEPTSAAPAPKPMAASVPTVQSTIGKFSDPEADARLRAMMAALPAPRVPDAAAIYSKRELIIKEFAPQPLPNMPQEAAWPQFTQTEAAPAPAPAAKAAAPANFGAITPAAPTMPQRAAATGPAPFAERGPRINRLKHLPTAYEKYRSISEQRENEIEISNGLGEQQVELVAERMRLQALLKTQKQSYDRITGGEGKNPQAEKMLATVNEKLARLEERRDKSVAIWQPLGRLLDRLNDGIDGIPAQMKIELHTGEIAAAIKKGATVLEAVETVRTEIKKLRADANAINAAPIPSAQALALALAEIDALAERGRPNVYATIEHGEGIRWPKVAHHFALNPQHHEDIDAFAVNIWAHKDAYIASIKSEIAASADDANALTSEERSVKLAECHASILAAERKEEALICAGEEQRINIPRNPNADYRAVLNLADSLPPPVQN